MDFAAESRTGTTIRSCFVKLVREWGRGYAQTSESEQTSMPSLLRLLTVIAILCGVVYGGLYALAHFVKPSTREMSVSVSPTKFYKEH
jgi:hypothetical protein